MSIDLHDFFYLTDKVETRLGFNDEDLIRKASEIPLIREQMAELASQGFRYVGDTLGSANDGSKAFTDVDKRRIFIGRNKSTDEAVLSLSYEMVNAKNEKRLNAIFQEYTSDVLPEYDRGLSYSKEILKVESEAVFTRSYIAIILGKEALIKNQKYIEIVKSHLKEPRVAIQEIFKEMVEHGTVHNGKISAVKHYIQQYFEATS